MNADKKIKEKIVSHSIVETSKVFKRLSALIIFSAFFALSLIVLFRIGDMSIKLPVVKKYIWLVEILLTLWWTSRFAIKNIKKAYFSMHVSYTLGAALIAYCSVMVYNTIDYQPTSWLDLRKLFVWFTPIMGINAFWKFMFVILEYKVRPFFAQKMAVETFQDIIVISMFWVTAELLDMYLVQKIVMSMEDIKQSLMIVSLVGAVLVLLSLWYFSFIKYWKFTEYGRDGLKKAMLWNSLMKLGSLTVWFIWRDTHMHINKQWWVLSISSAVLIIILVIFGLNKKLSGGGSKIYTFLAASIITLIGMGTYVMEMWWGSNSLDLLPIVLAAFTAIYILDIIIEPSTTWWISRSFNNVVSALAIYVLLDWVLGDYFGNNMAKLPFSINDMVVIPFLIGITSLEVSSIVSAWMRYNTITRSASMILKAQNQKGVKHE